MPRIITIDFDADGQIIYIPASLHAQRGDFVQWRCLYGPFAINFSTRSPFGKVKLRSIASDSYQVTPPEQVRDDASFSHYHYASAVVRGADFRGVDRFGVVYLDAGCPEIIIEM